MPANLLAALAAALLGLLIAPLLNALADDLPHRAGPGRPHCHRCAMPYHPQQWLAVAALLAGRSRCGRCHEQLHWRKPLVEVASAVALAGMAWKFGPTLRTALLGLLFECLLLITLIDLEHRLILHITILPSAAAALLYGLLGRDFDLPTAAARSLSGGAVGFLVFYVFFLLGQVYGRWVAWRRGEPLEEVAFGGGDANLAGVVGLAVGWPGIILTIFYSVLAGGVVAALFLVGQAARRRNALLTPIPYGPYIVFGAFVVLLFAEQLRTLGGAP